MNNSDKSDREPDEAGYLRYIEDTNRREISNSEAYDKALLTLSSVMLGISLTFTQNVVDLKTANTVWLLVGSWMLFSLTIIMVISSFIYGQYQFRELKKNAKVYFLDRDESVNEMSEASSSNIWIFNSLCGLMFILAIICFAIFIAINLLGAT